MPSLRNGLLLPLPALLACGLPCESQLVMRSLGGPRHRCPRSLVETTEPDPTTTTDTPTTSTTSDCDTDACVECGNAVVERDEECDDGNGIDEDACTNACTKASCGDGFIQPPEECDDGNTVDKDACTNSCKLPKCGDNIVQQDEQCDDGPTQTATCEVDCSPPICGDGVLNTLVEPPEQCDNGDNTDPVYSPDPPAPDDCAQNCVAVEYCGDNIKNGPGPEPCDDGNDNNSDACTNDCKEASCGDGFVQPGEQCDDGGIKPGDGCSEECLEERFVFVSPHQFFGDLSTNDNNNFPMLDAALKGIPRADAYCTAVANDGRPYKAWLSDSITSPATRFDAARNSFPGLYRLASPSASIVARGWQDLTNGDDLENPISADFEGKPVNENVWTHTLPNGTSVNSENSPCANWTSQMKTAFVGKSAAKDSTWTHLVDPDFPNGYPCGVPLRIYCFQDP